MSTENPIFGVDISHYNQGFSIRKAKRQGIGFVFAKATEGPYRDGSSYVDPAYRGFRRAARLARLPFGAYHFLTHTPIEAQVDHFLKNVGRLKGKMLMVDFEAYSSYPSLTPSNNDLERFVAILHRKTNRHAVVLYSGEGFWKGGDSSGAFSRYGAEAAWDAYYPLGDRVNGYRQLYEQVRDRGWGERWGGVVPVMWQYTPSGHVAGRNVDCNAFRGTKEQLLALARG